MEQTDKNTDGAPSTTTATSSADTLPAAAARPESTAAPTIPSPPEAGDQTTSTVSAASPSTSTTTTITTKLDESSADSSPNDAPAPSASLLDSSDAQPPAAVVDSGSTTPPVVSASSEPVMPAAAAAAPSSDRLDQVDEPSSSTSPEEDLPSPHPQPIVAAPSADNSVNCESTVTAVEQTEAAGTPPTAVVASETATPPPSSTPSPPATSSSLSIQEEVVESRHCDTIAAETASSSSSSSSAASVVDATTANVSGSEEQRTAGAAVAADAANVVVNATCDSSAIDSSAASSNDNSVAATATATAAATTTTTAASTTTTTADPIAVSEMSAPRTAACNVTAKAADSSSVDGEAMAVDSPVISSSAASEMEAAETAAAAATAQAQAAGARAAAAAAAAAQAAQDLEEAETALFWRNHQFKKARLRGSLSATVGAPSAAAPPTIVFESNAVRPVEERISPSSSSSSSTTTSNSINNSTTVVTPCTFTNTATTTSSGTSRAPNNVQYLFDNKQPERPASVSSDDGSVSELVIDETPRDDSFEERTPKNDGPAKSGDNNESSSAESSARRLYERHNGASGAIVSSCNGIGGAAHSSWTQPQSSLRQPPPLINSTFDATKAVSSGSADLNAVPRKSSLYVQNPDFTKHSASHGTSNGVSQSTSSAKDLSSLHMKPPDFTKICQTYSTSNDLKIAVQSSGAEQPSPSTVAAVPATVVHPGNFAEISKRRNYISDLQLKTPAAPEQTPQGALAPAVAAPTAAPVTTNDQRRSYNYPLIKAPDFTKSAQNFAPTRPAVSPVDEPRAHIIHKNSNASQAAPLPPHKPMPEAIPAPAIVYKAYPQISQDVTMSIVPNQPPQSQPQQQQPQQQLPQQPHHQPLSRAAPEPFAQSRVPFTAPFITTAAAQQPPPLKQTTTSYPPYADHRRNHHHHPQQQQLQQTQQPHLTTDTYRSSAEMPPHSYGNRIPDPYAASREQSPHSAPHYPMPSSGYGGHNSQSAAGKPNINDRPAPHHPSHPSHAPSLTGPSSSNASSSAAAASASSSSSAAASSSYQPRPYPHNMPENYVKQNSSYIPRNEDPGTYYETSTSKPQHHHPMPGPGHQLMHHPQAPPPQQHQRVPVYPNASGHHSQQPQPQQHQLPPHMQSHGYPSQPPLNAFASTGPPPSDHSSSSGPHKSRSRTKHPPTTAAHIQPPPLAASDHHGSGTMHPPQHWPGSGRVSQSPISLSSSPLSTGSVNNGRSVSRSPHGHASASPHPPSHTPQHQPPPHSGYDPATSPYQSYSPIASPVGGHKAPMPPMMYGHGSSSSLAPPSQSSAMPGAPPNPQFYPPPEIQYRDHRQSTANAINSKRSHSSPSTAPVAAADFVDLTKSPASTSKRPVDRPMAGGSAKPGARPDKPAYAATIMDPYVFRQSSEDALNYEIIKKTLNKDARRPDQMMGAGQPPHSYHAPGVSSAPQRSHSQQHDTSSVPVELSHRRDLTIIPSQQLQSRSAAPPANAPLGYAPPALAPPPSAPAPHYQYYPQPVMHSSATHIKQEPLVSSAPPPPQPQPQPSTSRQASFAAAPMPSRRDTRPLDLSVKTVKTKADSTGCENYSTGGASTPTTTAAAPAAASSSPSPMAASSTSAARSVSLVQTPSLKVDFAPNFSHSHREPPAASGGRGGGVAQRPPPIQFNASVAAPSSAPSFAAAAPPQTQPQGPPPSSVPMIMPLPGQSSQSAGRAPAGGQRHYLQPQQQEQLHQQQLQHRQLLQSYGPTHQLHYMYGNQQPQQQQQLQQPQQLPPPPPQQQQQQQQRNNAAPITQRPSKNAAATKPTAEPVNMFVHNPSVPTVFGAKPEELKNLPVIEPVVHQSAHPSSQPAPSVQYPAVIRRPNDHLRYLQPDPNARPPVTEQSPSAPPSAVNSSAPPPLVQLSSGQRQRQPEPSGAATRPPIGGDYYGRGAMPHPLHSPYYPNTSSATSVYPPSSASLSSASSLGSAAPPLTNGNADHYPHGSYAGKRVLEGPAQSPDGQPAAATHAMQLPHQQHHQNHNQHPSHQQPHQRQPSGDHKRMADVAFEPHDVVKRERKDQPMTMISSSPYPPQGAVYRGPFDDPNQSRGLYATTTHIDEPMKPAMSSASMQPNNRPYYSAPGQHSAPQVWYPPSEQPWPARNNVAPQSAAANVNQRPPAAQTQPSQTLPLPPAPVANHLSSSVPVPYRGADKGVITKLRTNLELKEQQKMRHSSSSSTTTSEAPINCNGVSPATPAVPAAATVDDEGHNKSDMASLIAARIRTKGELKGFTPIPIAAVVANAAAAAIDTKPAVTLALAPVPVAPVQPPPPVESAPPVEAISFEDRLKAEFAEFSTVRLNVELDEFPVRANSNSNSAFDLMDWGSACDGFQQQLQTSTPTAVIPGAVQGKKPRGRSRGAPKSALAGGADLHDANVSAGDLPGSDYKCDLDPRLLVDVWGEQKKQEQRPEAKSTGGGATATLSSSSSSSSDEDTPLGVLRQQSLNEAKIRSEVEGLNKGRPLQPPPPPPQPTTLPTLRAERVDMLERLSREHVARVKKEQQRVKREQEKKLTIASSSSDDEAAVGTGTGTAADTSPPRAQRSKKMLRKSRTPKTPPRASRKDSSSDDDDQSTEGPQSLKRKRHGDTTDNSEPRNDRYRKVSKLDSDSKPATSEEDEAKPTINSAAIKSEEPVNAKRTLETDSDSESSSSEEDTKPRAKKTPIVLETMTRSKRKLELEQQKANSKVLRNDKIVKNVSATGSSKEKTPLKSKLLNKSSLRGEEGSDKATATTTTPPTRRGSARKNTNTAGSDSAASDDEPPANVRLRTRLSKSISDSQTPDKTSKASTSAPDKTTTSSKKSTTKSKAAAAATKPPTVEKPQPFPVGWEEQLYEYKRSLKIPVSLITVGRPAGGNHHRKSISLPDLDPQHSSDTSELFSEHKRKLLESQMAAATGQIKKEGNKRGRPAKIKPAPAVETPPPTPLAVQSTPASPSKSSSIIDVLHQRYIRPSGSSFGGGPFRGRGHKAYHQRTFNNEPKILPQSNEAELLPTPGTEGDQAFRRSNVFETPVLKSRTRNEHLAQKTQDIIRGVFGCGDGDLRPASAPPLNCDSNTGDEASSGATETARKQPLVKQEANADGGDENSSSMYTTFDQKYQQYLQKMNIDIGDKIRKKHPGVVPTQGAATESIATPKTSPVNSSAASPLLLHTIKLEKMDDDDETQDTLLNEGIDIKAEPRHEADDDEDDDDDEMDDDGEEASDRGTPSVMSAMSAEDAIDRRTPSHQQQHQQHHQQQQQRLLSSGRKAGRGGHRSARRKGSSGFDYIRKKKRPAAASLSANGTPIAVQPKVPRRSAAINYLEVKDESDIRGEIRGWVLQKGLGESVLHKAARLGYMDVIAYCVERLDMSPNQKDNAGYTPLHEACSRGYLDIAKLLLRYGANHSDTAYAGKRPLHEAVENGYVEIVRLLLAYGADPMLATYGGQTPIMLAEDNDEMIQFLKSNQKDIQYTGPNSKPWRFEGAWHSYDPDECGFDIFADVPDADDPFDAEHSAINATSSQATTPTSFAGSALSSSNTTSTTTVTGKRDSNANDILLSPNLTRPAPANPNNRHMNSVTAVYKSLSSCSVRLGSIETKAAAAAVVEAKPGRPPTKIGGSVSDSDEDEQRKTNENDDDSDGELFEIEESEAPHVPLYTLRDEGAVKWAMLTDLCGMLKVKSKDTLMKQICPASPPSSEQHRELLRELKMDEFLQRSTCHQLLCAGEKLNINSSKVVLVKYNDSVKRVLGVKTTFMRL